MPSSDTHLIAFLDVLGFQSLIDSDTPISEIGEKFDSMLEEILLPYKPDINISTFSDNILASIELKNDEDEWKNILFFMLVIANIQWRFLYNGPYFSRGGVVLGDFFQGEHAIVSRGLVEAYKIESQFANYPRILVRKEIIDHYTQFEDVPKRQSRWFKYLFIKTAHLDFYQLDYLVAHHLIISIISGTVDGMDSTLLLALKMHKRWIEKNLNSELNLKIIEKYDLTARYHNSFCDKLPNLIKGILKEDALPFNVIPHLKALEAKLSSSDLNGYRINLPLA